MVELARTAELDELRSIVGTLAPMSRALAELATLVAVASLAETPAQRSIAAAEARELAPAVQERLASLAAFTQGEPRGPTRDLRCFLKQHARGFRLHLDGLLCELARLERDASDA